MPKRGNEGKVCDAVARMLEKRTGKTRKDVRNPEKDGIGPPVDIRLKLGCQEYAIEHTIIESYENQIRNSRAYWDIQEYLKENVEGKLPDEAYYELQIPTKTTMPKKERKRGKLRKEIGDWVRATANDMDERRKTGCRGCLRYTSYYERVVGKIESPNWEVALVREGDVQIGEDGKAVIQTKWMLQENVEEQRWERLRDAYGRKCPKLEEAKREGARTILILENIDTNLGWFGVIGRMIPRLAQEKIKGPDEIYLAEKHQGSFMILTMKKGELHWPPTDSLMWEDERNVDPWEGQPEHLRKAMDPEYGRPPSIWKPVGFKEDNLTDLKEAGVRIRPRGCPAG